MKYLVKVCKNGTKVWAEDVACDRCGGTGTYTWGAVINGVPQFAGTCYKCSGSGLVTRQFKEFTPEHEAELEAKRIAKAEKEEAERAERIAQAEAKRAEEERILKEREEARKAQKAVSQWVGEIGQKITVDVVEWDSFEFDTQWGSQTCYIMKDASGNVMKWFTSASLGYYDENGVYVYAPEQFKIKATVKDHSEYRDEKQTVLKSVKVIG